MNCQHIFLKGRKQNQKCNVENCTKHKPKNVCTYILTIGKNKGNECAKNNCKKHTGLPCNFVLKNEKLTEQKREAVRQKLSIICKKDENIDEILKSLEAYCLIVINQL